LARLNQDELTVHGIKVDSVEEYNVAQALDKMKLEYAYQKYLGASEERGTFIIDFLVYTVPKPTPLLVHGEYWHTGKYAAETALKEAMINARMRGTWRDIVIIWENECQSVDDAYYALQKKL
jgi:hypothetical protein